MGPEVLKKKIGSQWLQGVHSLLNKSSINGTYLKVLASDEMKADVVDIYPCEDTFLNRKQCSCRRNMTNNNDVSTMEIKCPPSFIIAGTQKSGTTVLAGILNSHPNIVISQKKEIHFFDRNKEYSKGLSKYLESFPFVNYTTTLPVFGEATPFYLADRYSCQRISAMLPDVKLIILLREPISRAYSEYQMKKRRVEEQVNFVRLLAKHSAALYVCLRGKLESAVTYGDMLVYFKDCAAVELKSHDSWEKLEKGLSRVYKTSGGSIMSLINNCFIPVFPTYSNRTSPLQFASEQPVGGNVGEYTAPSAMRGEKGNLEYSLQISCFPRLTGERLKPLERAFIGELQEFLDCAGLNLFDNIDVFNKAVVRCIDVSHGISTQYVYRSMYASQLKSCFKSISKRQFLILSSEELDQKLVATLEKVWSFLNVSSINVSTDIHSLISTSFPRFEALSGWKLKSSYDEMPTRIREALVPFFDAHNALLNELIQSD